MACWSSSSSLVVERRDAGEVLALEQLQRGAAARAAVGDLVLSAVLLAGRGGVTAADHGDDAALRGLDDGIHQRLRALLELGHLEDTHRPVPNYGLRLQHSLRVALDGLRAAIEAHEAFRDAGLFGRLLDLAILAKLRGDHKVRREDDLDPELGRLLHDLRHDLRTLLVVERGANFHLVVDFKEGVGHATTDDHLVHLVQHVHDQLDLVAHLRATQDREHRLRGRIEDLGEGVQLLGHEATGALHLVALAHHGAVGAVCGAEGVVAIHVRERLQRRPESRHRVLLCLDLVPLRVDALALLLDVEAEVLQEDHRPRGGIGADLLNLRTNAIAAESHGLAELFLDNLGHGSKRVLFHPAAVGTPQVRCQNHRLGPSLQDGLDSRQGAIDALSVGDFRRVALVLWHVEVDTHEDAFVLHINIIDLQLGWHACWRE
mmetsp:Transcript_56425/g.147063  ORF Transcript_56425/g.147063 Transcript_56425/m.147063 type:complete len:432 (-) Transcript_56425:63-1358(-)